MRSMVNYSQLSFSLTSSCSSVVTLLRSPSTSSSLSVGRFELESSGSRLAAFVGRFGGDWSLYEDFFASLGLVEYPIVVPGCVVESSDGSVLLKMCIELSFSASGWLETIFVRFIGSASVMRWAFVLVSVLRQRGWEIDSIRCGRDVPKR